MDFGTEFEEDFFEGPRIRVLKRPLNYEAKFILPLWYMENELAGTEQEDVLVALKHQSDYHYFSKNYEKAAELYEKCLELTPECNNTWKREFMENLARSWLQMDNPQKALEWSLKLDKFSFSPDQKIVSMNLLARVCHKLGKYKEELEALHCCLEAHKSCPEFWQRLGLCYAGLFNIYLPVYSSCKPVREGSEPCCAFSLKVNHSEEVATVPESAVSSCETAEKNSEEEKSPSTKCDVCTLGIQIVSSCLIHTKMLIYSEGPNLLGAEKVKETQEKIANSLEHMEVDESFIEVASKMLGTDFLASLQMCENSLEQQSGYSSKSNERNVHETDG